MAKKYVIVGVNRYIRNTHPTTEGAVNSALTWKKILDNRGFKGTILLNEFADSDSVRNEFGAMMEGLKKKDFACFIYIGHGSQQKIDAVKNEAADEDEVDGFDELLYPYFGSVSDNEIRKILDLNDKNAPVLVILDCCTNGVIESLKLFDEKKNEIVISGSEPTENSEVNTIDSYRQFVFSHFAQYVLLNNDVNDYEEYIDKIVEKIASSKYLQRPQLIYSNYNILSSKPFESTVPILSADALPIKIGPPVPPKNIAQGQIKHNKPDLLKFTATKTLERDINTKILTLKTKKNENN